MVVALWFGSSLCFVLGLLSNQTIDLVFKTPWYLRPTNRPNGAVLAVTVCTTRTTCDIEFRVAVVTLRQNTDPLRSSGPDKYFIGLLGHPMCLSILTWSTRILGVSRAGILLASTTTIPVLQISQRRHVKCVVGKGFVGDNRRCAWPEEVARGVSGMNLKEACARGSESQQGYTRVKSSSI